MRRLDDALADGLAARAARGRLRQRHASHHAGVELLRDGRRFINFCGNDYLGLSDHPALRGALAGAGRAGSGASPLVTGFAPEHAELEAVIADFTGREAALVFSTGFAANVGSIDALLGRADRAVCDALNHASLIDGVRLSGAGKAIYPHADLTAAEQALQTPAPRTLLISDHVFSMDGDVADAAGLARLAADAGAHLMLDEAHGSGVLGPDGRGVAGTLDQAALPILVGTFGKAFGCAGAFVAGSRVLIEHLVNHARSQIYSTALPPAVAAAAAAGVRTAQSDAWRREALFERIAQFRAGARRLGLALCPSDTPIQPLVLGDDRTAVAWSEALAAQGQLVSAIRPPTVPEGTARLRITVSAAHTAAQVDGLLAALAATQDRPAAS